MFYLAAFTLKHTQECVFWPDQESRQREAPAPATHNHLSSEPPPTRPDPDDLPLSRDIHPRPPLAPAPGSFPVTPLAASIPTNSSITLGHQGDDGLGPHPRWGGVVCKPALARDGRVGLKLQMF
ncbi:hypothetical protein R6Q59_001914 [Mikania micrantha]